jgi:tRNA(Arg) A34 adenosine deaminase TadA
MPVREIRLLIPDWVEREIDPRAIYMDAEARVELAIRLARRNVEQRSGGPFGAAIFDGEGHVVAAGVNGVVAQQGSLGHAETMAFMSAQARLGRARLNEDGGRYVLATSAQPCAMCYGASLWAGIDEILIGARASDVMELTAFDEGPLPADWSGELERRGIRVQRDILRDAACAVLARYSREGGIPY